MELDQLPRPEQAAVDHMHGGSRQKSSADSRPPPRQACVECRRRKIKCNGFGKSGCKTCKAAGVDCVFPESQRRGPHKGYFETISTRLSRIERMLQNAIEKQDKQKREASSDEEFEADRERRRRRSIAKQHRHSHDRRLTPMAALLAPKSTTAPDIPFNSYRPQLIPMGIESPPPSPEESALGVLAQVAHEIDRPAIRNPVSQNYFTDPSRLPDDLADPLVQLYFSNIHNLFPIIPKRDFSSLFQSRSHTLPDYLLYAIFLAASSLSEDPRLLEGPYSRAQLETKLKQACDTARQFSTASDLSLIQSLMLSQLFPVKREKKVALLSWTINGRAVKLALKRKLNVDPRGLKLDSDVVESRILTWWCVYLVDIWDAARRGRPPTIHEGDYDVPLPSISTASSEEEVYFARLVRLTRILSAVLFFAYNNHQTASSLGASIDLQTEETIRNLRTQLAEWHRAEGLPRTTIMLEDVLQVAYLTVVILLHRPLLPTPLATAYSDPILLLITRCASSIVRIARHTENTITGSVPRRLFVPAVGYLTAGVTLAQNATWSTHITGAKALRLSAQSDITILLDVFDRAQSKGQQMAGISGLLRQIFAVSGVDIETSSITMIPEIQGTAIPLPDEDPSFSMTQRRSSTEKVATQSERRPSAASYQLVTPTAVATPRYSQSEPNSQKRKHSQISHLTTSTPKPAGGQQLPSLANLTVLDAGRRSPGVRSVHSMSTYSSRSSNSLGRKGTLYPPGPPPPVSTAYHPSWGQTDRPPPRWDPSRPMSPIYDRGYSEKQSSYASSSRDYAPPSRQSNPYYLETREEYYPRATSPHTAYPVPPNEPNPPPVIAYRQSYAPSQSELTYPRPTPQSDPRYRNPTPPLSSAASNSPSWPTGYPYANNPRYDTTSPRTGHSNPAPPPPPHPPPPPLPMPMPPNRWPGRQDYYFPPPSR